MMELIRVEDNQFRFTCEVTIRLRVTGRSNDAQWIALQQMQARVGAVWLTDEEESPARQPSQRITLDEED